MCLLPYGLNAVTYFATSPENFAREFDHWYNSPLLSESLTYEWLPDGRLSDGVEFVSDRSWIPYRAFLIQAEGWIGFFNNQSGQHLPQATMATMSNRLKVDACFFYYVEDYATQFRYYRFDGADIQRRSIMLYEEAGWQFSNNGEPLVFENTQYYQKRRLKDRINLDILLEYASSIGVPHGPEAKFGKGIFQFTWTDFNKA